MVNLRSRSVIRTLDIPAGPSQIILKAAENMLYVATLSMLMGLVLLALQVTAESGESQAHTAGATAHIKIAVTATGFTITRTDTGSTPITSTDTAYRAGYIQIARYSTADGVGQFKNIVVS